MEQLTHLLDELHLSKEKSIQKILEPDGSLLFIKYFLTKQRKNPSFLRSFQIQSKKQKARAKHNDNNKSYLQSIENK